MSEPLLKDFVELTKLVRQSTRQSRLQIEALQIAISVIIDQADPPIREAVLDALKRHATSPDGDLDAAPSSVLSALRASTSS